MEYGVPREHGPEAARRVIEWIRTNRYPVFFPIEMRVTAGDDALLSPSHERDTAYIAVHQYRGMEWRPYFEAVEAIMNEFGGRPHWGKRHFQTAADAGAALPALGRFPSRPRRSSTPVASSPTSTPSASSARRRLEEGSSLAAVGGDDVDDLLAFDQVQGVEALAELARLGVAHVDAVADLEVARRQRRSSGVCTSPAPSSGSSSSPGGSQGDGERGRHRRCRRRGSRRRARSRSRGVGLAHDRQGEAGSRGEAEAAVGSKRAGA